MRTVNAAQILEWEHQGKQVICLDIRERQSHQYLPVHGGFKIPFNKVKDNSTLLIPYREHITVIFGMNAANRCNRVHVAEQALYAMGFVQVYGLEDGLMEGWIKPTQRKKQLPGPTNQSTAF
jgi:hypothetical protein